MLWNLIIFLFRAKNVRQAYQRPLIAAGAFGEKKLMIRSYVNTVILPEPYQLLNELLIWRNFVPTGNDRYGSLLKNRQKRGGNTRFSNRTKILNSLALRSVLHITSITLYKNIWQNRGLVRPDRRANFGINEDFLWSLFDYSDVRKGQAKSFWGNFFEW